MSIMGGIGEPQKEEEVKRMGLVGLRFLRSVKMLQKNWKIFFQRNGSLPQISSRCNKDKVLPDKISKLVENMFVSLETIERPLLVCGKGELQSNTPRRKRKWKLFSLRSDSFRQWVHLCFQRYYLHLAKIDRIVGVWRVPGSYLQLT